ncbi:nuclear transport factor 2 family protein [Sphingobacterium pedocola]|uniref:Nuclear transport factor 2 family protein n=1 Tax=Sphingobacterium pedocola TaxID=2082722 RepID=A0ABR9T7B2_9SPHI|nr:nuclear transport factor 2 family protein [Sphingobacterium pedocola]MBE8721246.1 hypothetical protein [Sphingobacterium pedocola]
MNLPNTIAALVTAQDNFDSHRYANCFSETAIVLDEGKTYNGRAEIQRWIQKANDEFRIVMKPLEYSESEETLKAEVSGNFEGSPAVLTYHFALHEGKIQSLKITG